MIGHLNKYLTRLYSYDLRQQLLPKCHLPNAVFILSQKYSLFSRIQSLISVCIITMVHLIVSSGRYEIDLYFPSQRSLIDNYSNFCRTRKKKRFVQRKKRCFEQCVYRSMNGRAQEKKKTQSERPQHDQRKSVLYMTLNFLLSRIFFLAQIILRIPYNFWLEIANLSRDIALAGLLAYGKQNR